MATIGNSYYLAATALLLTPSTAACAHKDTALDCHVEGIKYLGTDLRAGAVCDRFAAGLGAAQPRIAAMHIEATERGAINVRLSLKNGETRELGMDIMDRPLKLSDIDQLAQIVGGQL